MPARYRVIFSRRAATDLQLIHDYIQRESPQNAAAVATELIGAIDSLELLPHRYPVHRGHRPPAAAVRRMPVPPFLVYYRVTDRPRVFGVITIRHGSRRQPRRFP